MSQSKEILAALKHGDRITPIDALTRFQCMRLASRISDLKHEGNTIHSKTIKNGKKRYSEYWMEVDPTMNLFKSNYGGLQ